MNDNLRYIFLELPKCRDVSESSVLEKFGFALRNIHRLPSQPSEMKGEIFDLLFHSAELSIFTPTEKIKYDNDMTTERDIRNYIAYARKEGLEQGLEKGLEKGREEGIEKGREEKAVSIAIDMIKEGFDKETVARLTDLPLKTIEALGQDD